MRIQVLSAVIALAAALLVPTPAIAAAGASVAPATIITAASLPAAKSAAAPPVQYHVTKAASLRGTAAASGRKLATVKSGTYLTARTTRAKWIRVAVGGKTGWFPLSNTKRLVQKRHEAIRKTTLRTSPGKGTVVVRVAKGKELVSTGRRSGKYLQLYTGGKTGWAPTADVRNAILAKYQTSSATAMYTTAKSAKKLSTIPADYTVGTRTMAAAKGRTQVEYAGKTGWVAASRAPKVGLGVPLGKLSWKASAVKNIAKWCKGVPLSAGPNRGNFATAEGWTGKMKESITLDTNGFGGARLDPNHPAAIAVQYHECAHILQFRAYKYDFTKLDRRMDAVYGKRNGTEHMADCMAVAMGAKLSGTERDSRSGYTTTWHAGYGGKCTSRHLGLAKKVIAGKAV